MLYVGIDQHTRQLTVSVRDEAGDVVFRKQVGTHPGKVTAFLEGLRNLACNHEGYVAIVEVCGFNEWLIQMLRDYECRQTIVVQPEEKLNRKTDRRDAGRLSELLWVNRERLLGGHKVNGLRVVELPDDVDAGNRQVTTIRKRLAQQKTRVINKIKRIIHKHNLIHVQPTKTFQTRAVRRWLSELSLPPVDRLEIGLLLKQWELLEEQLETVASEIGQRVSHDRYAQIILSIVGCGDFTALAIACRIGRVERFRRGRSLANFFGLTPTCHSSGESGDRLGHISKQGSTMVRFLLGQLITRVLRADPELRRWYQNVKRRRGAKIARVAVMRKLSTSIWHMLTYEEPYLPASRRRQENRPKFVSLPASRPGHREERMAL